MHSTKRISLGLGLALALLLAPQAARAAEAPAGMPEFWNNVGWAMTLGFVPPLALSLGTWLSERDDIPTSARGMFRGAIGAANRSDVNKPAMYLGLRTGSCCFRGKG